MKYVDIPLSTFAHYDLSVNLEGNSYILEFTYNERAKLYFMSIFSADREPILQGVGLVPNYPIAFDYAIPNMSGYFALIPKGTINIEAYKLYPENINEYYYLVYAYE